MVNVGLNVNRKMRSMSTIICVARTKEFDTNLVGLMLRRMATQNTCDGVR